MLRRKCPPDDPDSGFRDFVPYPAPIQAFDLEPNSVGIHFYRSDEAFYLPYSTLQAMHLKGDDLNLIFATDEVRIHGRSLHSLYVFLSEHRVHRVHEQGDRYEGLDSAVYVRQLERVPRTGQ